MNLDELIFAKKSKFGYRTIDQTDTNEITHVIFTYDQFLHYYNEFDNLEKQFNGYVQKIDNLEQQNNTLNSELTRMKKRV